MSTLRNAEGAISGFFDRIFGRMFRGYVEPVELARKLAREMEDHKTVSVSRVYVPNEYVVYLSDRDHERFASFEGSLTQELAGYLSQRARHEGFTLLSEPVVRIETDHDLSVGAYGIACRVVDLPADGTEPEPHVAPEEALAFPSTAMRPVPTDVPFKPFDPEPDSPFVADDVADVPVPPVVDASAEAELAPDLPKWSDLPAVDEVAPVAEAQEAVASAVEDADVADAPDAAAVASPVPVDAEAVDAPEPETPSVPEPEPDPAPVMDDLPAEPAPASEPVAPPNVIHEPLAPPPIGIPMAPAAAAPLPPVPPVVPPPVVPDVHVPARPLPPPGGYEPLAGVSGTQIFPSAAAPDDGIVQEEVSLIIDGRRMRLSRRTTTLGRSRDCDIALSDPNASRQHAEIRHIGLDYFLVDQNSTNGTYVNGQRVRRHALADGDRITIGTTEMIVEHIASGRG